MLTTATLTVRATEAVACDPIPFHDATAAVPATIKGCLPIIGGLSAPEKMPCESYSLSAFKCKTGSALRKVEGSTCASCYACTGAYRFPGTVNAMQRRLDSLSDPRWTAAFIHILNRKRNAYFRWHDSGDLQSLNHLRNIVEVAKHTPRVSHWLPTREFAIVREYLRTYGEFPANLRVRVSAAMIDRSAPAEFEYTSEVCTVAPADPIADAMEGKRHCPAYKQNGLCSGDLIDCRSCWSTCKTIVYPLH
jgi:hypothetical protein